ncbi:Hypothetical_protein [Hexamita inflata]|uniref:Hypothetical_protein n=1 Tax=Hexamita inflata TaxID=28002 RepID=A0AA86V5W0_9EUKA|nr:Hypothetical protein HINF_LOCUS65132 [Hexamita inflata]
MGSRRCFHFQNGLNPSFMPTQQRPNRAFTESFGGPVSLLKTDWSVLTLHSNVIFILIQFMKPKLYSYSYSMTYQCAINVLQMLPQGCLFIFVSNIRYIDVDYVVLNENKSNKI